MTLLKFLALSVFYFLLVIQPASSTEVIPCVSCDGDKMQTLAQKTPLFGSLLVFDPTSQQANKYLVSNYQGATPSSVAVPIYLPPNEQTFVNAMSELYAKIGDKKHLEVTLDLTKITEFEHISAQELYRNSQLNQKLGRLIGQNFVELAKDDEYALLMMKSMKIAVDAMLQVDLSMTLILQCSDSSQLVYKIAVENALLAELQAKDPRNFDSHHQIFAEN